MGGRLSYGRTRIGPRREGRLFAEPSAAGISATSFHRRVAGGRRAPMAWNSCALRALTLDNDWTRRRDASIGRE